MRRALLRILVPVAALAAAGALGWWAGRPGAAPEPLDAHTQSRLLVIGQHLAEAEPDSILIAGDSHAELQDPAARLCGAGLVNAGISGASAARYGDWLSRLAVPTRFRAAILTIGTNDLAGERDALAKSKADAFEKSVEAIVAQLAAFSGRVVVTAVPPVDRALGETFDAAAIDGYSERIRRLCARIGCLHADPFAALRDGASGFGLPGVNKDGLHLARYRPVLHDLAATLCPADADAEP